MPLAPNPLLQATPVAKPQPVAASSTVKFAETGKDNTPSFAHVFAKEARPKADKPAMDHDERIKPAHDKPTVANGKDKADGKPAASKPEVADSGKSLPADKVNKKAGNDHDDDDSADDKPADPTPVVAAPVDPTLDPVAMQALIVQPTETPVAVDVVATATDAATPVVAALPPATPAPVDDFDPAADPLEGLPAVQVALAQNAKPQPTTAPTAEHTSAKASPAQGDIDPAQALVSNLTVLADQQPADGSSTEGGDKAFKGLIEDGLKDTTSAASDTRVDDFANRLAALSQAVQPKASAALPMTPLGQPLAMHQSGWTDEVVNRVMYLSSQNLKSADIQLEPAELGRLDIRVNMAADQQTQITFMSAHVGVREALEGQMGRLRESFTQQGLGQVDVNVSDQARGWQGQGQGQEQASDGQRRSGGAGASSDRGDGLDDTSIHGVAQTSQPVTVIGSSAVDYYA